jgi:NAD-dependent dihydropyrimidine dehydrogenase PreA subunit
MTQRTADQVSINAEACISCGRCTLACPTNVFRMGADGKAVVAYPDDCCVCRLCVDDCPAQCITVSPAVSNFRSIYDQMGEAGGR